MFFPFLEKEFPNLVENYRQRYKDRAFLPKAFSQRLSQLMARLRQKHGIPSHHDRYNRRMQSLHRTEAQLTLF